MHCNVSCLIAALAILVQSAGCIHQERARFQPDAPTLLRASARDLFAAQRQDILVESDTVVRDIPVTTQLIRRVAEESKRAVVSIYVRTRTPYRLKVVPFSPFGGIRIRVPGVGLGSGFFIHPSGYILTNNHVIESADEIRILTSDGTDYVATVLARDPAYDLALLKAEGSRQFHALPMQDSDTVDTGEMVLAVGNPLGLGHTVTAGIISQTGRNLTGEPTEGTRHIDYIQTDTAINPGSSGGPLITLNGAWVGVNTSSITEAQGLGFAVPSRQAQEFLDEVLAGKGEFE
jgi:S1-C subfamily serine protease